MKPIFRAGAHIAGLWTLAVAQPLFDVLGRAPEFFVAHRVDGFDRVILAASLALLVPALILGALLILGRFSGRLADLAAAISIGILAGVLSAQVAYRFGASGWTSTLLVGSATAALMGFAWLRAASVRAFLTILSPAALVVPGIFLIANGHGVAAPERSKETVVEPRRLPVVVFVFDELSLVSLMDSEGRINRARYPHLAALAADGIWFRNATAVSDYTRWALPAILTGRYPTARSEPTPQDHPDTLFSLLGRSHRLKVFESVTALCAPTLCVPQDSRTFDRLRAIAGDLLVVAAHLYLPPNAREGLPDLTENWAGFNADGSDSDRLMTTIPRPTRTRHQAGGGFGGRPRAVTILHRPEPLLTASWPMTRQQLCTSCTRWPRTTRRGGCRPVNALPTVAQFRDHEVERSSRTRGSLNNCSMNTCCKPVSPTSWSASCVTVSLRQGDMKTRSSSLRPITARRSGLAVRCANSFPSNAPDVVPVPFIVKLPVGSAGPSPGTIDDSNVETIDVLPTVADALGVTVPWAIDGQSAIGSASRRPEKRMYYNQGTAHATYASDGLVAQRDAAVKRQTALFGDDAWPVFSLPDLRHLIGRELGSFDPIGATEVRLIFDNQDALKNVDLDAPQLPAQIIGRVRGGLSPTSAATRVAVVLNGTVVATTRAWPGRVHWMAMLPPAALKAGTNRVDLLVVDPANNSRLLMHP